MPATKDFCKTWKLKENKEKMTDEQFAAFLNKKVRPAVAKVQTGDILRCQQSILQTD